MDEKPVWRAIERIHFPTIPFALLCGYDWDRCLPNERHGVSRDHRYHGTKRHANLHCSPSPPRCDVLANTRDNPTIRTQRIDRSFRSGAHKRGNAITALDLE